MWQPLASLCSPWHARKCLNIGNIKFISKIFLYSGGQDSTISVLRVVCDSGLWCDVIIRLLYSLSVILQKVQTDSWDVWFTDNYVEILVVCVCVCVCVCMYVCVCVCVCVFIYLCFVDRASWYHSFATRVSQLKFSDYYINHLTPNGHYMGRTAQLNSRYCILYIYSTNIRAKYFKHAA